MQEPVGAPRFDAYRPIHKALRHAMTEALFVAGRLDPADACDVAKVVEQGRALLTLCETHLKKENAFVHPAMEARAPGSTADTVRQHAHHEDEIVRVGSLLDILEGAPDGHRAAAAVEYYRELGLFVGDNFVHMHQEETENDPILWQHYSDDELMALDAEIVTSISPAEKSQALRWMMPAFNPQERAGMLAAMRAAVPAPVFAGMLDMVKPLLSDLDWRKLTIGLSHLAKAA